ncbi:MAG: hypothetical protein L0Z50_14655 [Verrucomicrobiales bacterium]|nr:hypothetical protein [Verrucomicrobiales bacterium]
MNILLSRTVIGASVLVFCADATAQVVSRQIGTRTFRSSGLLLDEVDPLGNTSRHHYQAGSLSAVELPEGLNRTFSSSHATALPQTGLLTTPEYPERGAASGSAPAGSGAEYGGGSLRQHPFILGGDAKVIESREGNIVTTLLRNVDGMVTRLGLPSGHRFDLTYDNRGNVVSVRDATFGGTTTVTYDPVHGLPVEFVYPGGGFQRLEYDAAGNLVTRITPEGRRQAVTWGAAGQMDTVTDEFGTKTTFGYGMAGNLESLRQGEGATERVAGLVRDTAGRVTRVDAPEGRSFSYAYHASGRLSAFTDSQGHAAQLEEDGNGEVTALVLPGGARHAWTYDGLRRIATYTQPGQPAIGYDYNVHSDPTAIRVQEQRVAEFSYNDRGQMLTHSESAPEVAPFAVTRVYNNTSSGQLIQADSSDGIRMVPTYRGEFTRRLTWSRALAGFYDVEIDAGHRITSGQVGSGPRIAYTYDRDNLTLSAGDLVFTRDPRTGLVTAATLGVVAEQFQYNGFGELVAQTAQANGTPFFSAQIKRDKLGRIVEIVENVRDATTTIACAYDAGGRLESVRRNGVVTESYAYDARGNLVSDDLNGGYTYNEADQLLSAGGASFTYTASGERLTRTRGGASETYRYTPLSTLRGVDLADGRVLRYLHDPAGNRAIRTMDGVIQQRFLCPDFNQPVATLNAAGETTARYVHGLAEATPDYILQDGAAYRIVSDHLGSVRFVVHAQTGEIVQQKSYDTYGRTLSDSAPGFQPFGFAGGWTDSDTGLIRFGARDYDSEVRR